MDYIHGHVHGNSTCFLQPSHAGAEGCSHQCVVVVQYSVGAAATPCMHASIIVLRRYVCHDHVCCVYMQDAFGPAADAPRLQLSRELAAAVKRQWLVATRRSPKSRRSSAFAADVARVLRDQLGLTVRGEARTQDGLFSIDLALDWQGRWVKSARAGGRGQGLLFLERVGGGRAGCC